MIDHVDEITERFCCFVFPFAKLKDRKGIQDKVSGCGLGRKVSKLEKRFS